MEIPSQNWVDFYKLPENTIDVVFIGNSHDLNAFQPRIVNDLLPVYSYMIGVPGENICISYFELKEFLKYQKPKIVVLETFTLNLSQPVGTALIFPFTDAGGINLNKLAVDYRFLTFEQAYSVFPVLRTRIDWNSPSDFFIKMANSIKPKTMQTSSTLGANPDPEPMSDIEFSEIPNLPEITTNNFSDENKKYLDKFVELCEQNGIQLLLVSSPMLKLTGDFFTYYTPFDIDTYVEQNQLNYLNIDDSAYTKIHFANPDHLSVFGSIMATVDVAYKIAELMHINVDQKKIDYYRSLIFSDFDFSTAGDMYRLTLFPENQNKDLYYKYVLMDNDYKELSSTDWSQNNEFEFPLSGERLHVQVQVSKPGGDYILVGYFNNY